jgi:suppressor of ftsI
MPSSKKEKQQETPYEATLAAHLAAYTGSMRRPRSAIALVRLATMFTLLLGASTPPTLWAQARLENPGAGSFQSGIGVVSGWACNANRIEVVFDNAISVQAGYGTTRGDTHAVCGDDNNGFGLLLNWSLLGDGLHSIRVLADGVEIGNALYTVTTLGEEFLQGSGGSCTVGDFPAEGTNTTLEWEQSLQNFVITSVHTDGSGGGSSETFHNPPEITSSGGVLNATLRAEPKEIHIAGQKVMATVYNDLYTPPTLRVRPGDTMHIRLENTLEQGTNLHHHGANVSPLNNGDNVFLDIMPGQTFDQQITFPVDHAPGMLWYHPHLHGLVESQIFGGMSGALIVDGVLDPFPQLQGIKERIMLLKDFQNIGGQIPTDDIDSGAGTTRTINGIENPTLKIRPGETQFWRIGNVGADIYYRLKLDGHTLYELGKDGNRTNQLVAREEVLLPPGARTEVLVQGGRHGVYKLRTLYFDQGEDGDQYPEVTLATLISEGRAEEPIALPTKEQFPTVEDLRTQPIANRRTFVFSEDPDTNLFYINGLQFDENRIDTSVTLGTIEEWTIQNVANEEHVFHIHQLDFQVIEVDGKPVPFTGRQDVVNLPVKSEVKVLIPFTNPVIVGKFVYHCHIVAHEDNGMMAVIQVVQP